MSPHLVEQLNSRWPRIWGGAKIEVGDGWYTLLVSLTESVVEIMATHRKERLAVIRFNRALRAAIGGHRWPLYHLLWQTVRGLTTQDASPIKRAEQREREVDRLIAERAWREVPQPCPWPRIQQVSVTKDDERPLSIVLCDISRFKRDDWPHNSVMAVGYAMMRLSSHICELCGSPGSVVVDEDEGQPLHWSRWRGVLRTMFKPVVRVRCTICELIDVAAKDDTVIEREGDEV